MLIEANRSCLLVIDVQAKLVPAVQQHTELISHCKWMINVANLLKIPIIATEQYPHGLGPTVAELRELLDEQQIQDKTFFSCAESTECQALIDQQNREQIIIVGMETHICVLQTALGLIGQGKQVFVVADAVSSRSMQDTQLGIERMRDAGVQIVSREMVGFEWLKGSHAKQFKTFSQTFLQ